MAVADSAHDIVACNDAALKLGVRRGMSVSAASALVSDLHVVSRDLAFMGFVAAGMLALIVYIQQYGSLAVFLRDVHGIDSKGYGVILSITGLEVVLFQFWIIDIFLHGKDINCIRCLHMPGNRGRNFRKKTD